MIAQLTGTLVERDLTQVVLDVNGVGYALSVPLSTMDALPGVGSRVTLLTVMTVREDDIRLYGFATGRERRLFELLTSAVSGVGAKLALNVLSCMSIDLFVSSVLEGDLKVLSKISGVGKRTAERMVLELRDKVSGLGVEGSAAVGDTVSAGRGKASAEAGGGASGTSPLSVPSVRDAALALETLGFKREQAEKAVLAVLKTAGESATAEQLIRLALAALNS
ncbi:MAG: Holliday junction branch migration protein RuvA [Oligosphaeraceae bacterium]